MATAALQRWHLAIRHFCLFGGPVAAANDERTNERTIRTHERGDETAPPGLGPRRHFEGSLRITVITAVTADHGGHGRPRRSRQATAERFGRGVTAPAPRTRRVTESPGCAAGTAAGEGTTRAGGQVKQNEREHLLLAHFFVKCLVQ